MSRYRFRRLRDSDLDLVATWLAAPHVRRWWGDPDTELTHIRAHLRGRNVRPYLVSLAGRPFAYIQCDDLQGEPADPFGPQPPGTRGIDFLIGEADLVGQGHGGAMLAAFVRGAFRLPAITRVVSDPDPANGASIGALRRAGFADHGAITTSEGPARLMGIDRAG